MSPLPIMRPPIVIDTSVNETTQGSTSLSRSAAEFDSPRPLRAVLNRTSPHSVGPTDDRQSFTGPSGSSIQPALLQRSSRFSPLLTDPSATDPSAWIGLSGRSPLHAGVDLEPASGPSIQNQSVEFHDIHATLRQTLESLEGIRRDAEAGAINDIEMSYIDYSPKKDAH